MVAGALCALCGQHSTDIRLLHPLPDAAGADIVTVPCGTSAGSLGRLYTSVCCACTASKQQTGSKRRHDNEAAGSTVKKPCIQLPGPDLEEDITEQTKLEHTTLTDRLKATKQELDVATRMRDETEREVERAKEELSMLYDQIDSVATMVDSNDLVQNLGDGTHDAAHSTQHAMAEVHYTVLELIEIAKVRQVDISNCTTKKVKLEALVANGHVAKTKKSEVPAELAGKAGVKDASSSGGVDEEFAMDLHIKKMMLVEEMELVEMLARHTLMERRARNLRAVRQALQPSAANFTASSWLEEAVQSNERHSQLYLEFLGSTSEHNN